MIKRYRARTAGARETSIHRTGLELLCRCARTLPGTGASTCPAGLNTSNQPWPRLPPPILASKTAGQKGPLRISQMQPSHASFQPQHGPGASTPWPMPAGGRSEPERPGGGAPRGGSTPFNIQLQQDESQDYKPKRDNMNTRQAARHKDAVYRHTTAHPPSTRGRRAV